MSDPVVATLSAQYEAADTKTVPLSTLPLQVDDQILILICQNQSNTPIGLPGFSDVTGTAQAGQSAVRSALLIKTSGASESDVEIIGGAAVTTVALCVLRGVNSTTPVNIASQSNATGLTIDSPSVTTTADGCYIVNGLAGFDRTSSWALPPIDRRFIVRGIDGNARSHLCAFGQISAGATGTTNWKVVRSDYGSAYTVAFNMNSGFEPAVLTSGATLISKFGDVGNIHDGDTFTTLSSSISSINGVSVETAPHSTGFSNEYSNLIPGYPGANPTRFEFVAAGGSGIWQGVTFPSTIDAAGKTLEITLANSDALLMGPEGFVFILFDSSNNWEAFQVPQTELSTAGFGVTLRVSDLTTDIYDNFGTLDWSDINKVGFAWYRIGTNTSPRGPLVSNLILSDTEIFAAGSTGYPIKPSTIRKYLSYSGAIDCADQQGVHTLCRRPIQLGDGTTPTVVDFSQEVLESPGSNDNLFLSGKYSGIELYGSENCSFSFSGSIIRSNGQSFGFNASTSLSASYIFDNSVIIGFVVTWISGIDCTSATFIACDEVDGKDVTFTSCSWSDSTSNNAALSIDPGADLINCTFSKGVEIYGVEIDAAGAYDFSGTTFTGYAANNDINVTAVTGTVTITLIAGQAQPGFTSAGATVNFVQPVTTFNFNSDTADTIIRRFANDSQVIADSIIGTQLSYDFTSNDAVDVEYVKQGYVPINRQDVTPVDGASNDAQMDFDEAYNSAHGLTRTVEFDYNRDTKLLTINSDQNALDVRSALSDVIRIDSNYYNTPLLLEVIPGLTRVDLINGATITSMTTWKGAGMERFDATDSVNPVEKWLAIKSVGDITGSSAYYRQTISGDATNVTLTSNVVDEAFQYYRDDNHDGDTGDTNEYDYSSYMVIKTFQAGKKQGRVDVLANAGAPSLASNLYTVPLVNADESYSGTDPGISADLSLVAGSTVGGVVFSYEIVDGGTNTGADIASQLNYNAANNPNSIIPGGTGLRYFELPDMVINNATAQETERGFREGATPTQVGFYVSRGGNDHPDFTRFQGDNGAYYTPAVLNQVTISNLPTDGANIVLRIYNNTTATEIYAANPGGTSYSDTYVEGTDYSAGDEIDVRFAELNATASFKRFKTTVTAGAGGWSLNAGNFIESDTVYAANAVDGSLVNKFTYTPVDQQFNLAVAANFTAAELFAYYCFVLTTAPGIAGAYGGFVAIDSGNYMNVTSIANIFIDNETTASQRQTDTARIYKDDGSYPVLEPPTSGYGVQVNWQNVVYTVTVGSGPLTPAQESQLANTATQSSVTALSSNIATVDGKTDTIIIDVAAVKTDTVNILADTNELQQDWQDGGRLDSLLDSVSSQSSVTAIQADVSAVKSKTDQLTFTVANVLDSNIQNVNDVEITGTGVEGDPMRPA